MTRWKRSIGVGFTGLVLAASALAACRITAEPAASSSAALGGSGIEITSCPDCTCGNECDAATAWLCPSGACNAAGTCACDPAYAAFDCPSTGCCDVVIDIDGEPMVDPTGAPVYQCMTPTCTSDEQCGDGESCLSGATCGENTCGCPSGEGPDPEQPCCLTVNSNGVCCASGEVDGEGRCVCPDSLMTDTGHDCQCPAGMLADDNDHCVCADPHAVFDAALGACTCAAGYWLDFDPYTGDLICVTDGDEPTPCPDPHAVIDPVTGACGCEPGFVPGDTLETASAQCVPTTCGDDVCGENESCELCSYDCGSCGVPPDAGPPDAGAGSGSDATPPDAGSLDAGAPDAGPSDAAQGPQDAPLPTADAVLCDLTFGVRCGPGSGAP